VWESYPNSLHFPRRGVSRERHKTSSGNAVGPRRRVENSAADREIEPVEGHRDGRSATMKGSFCFSALVLVVFAVGCAGPNSPTAPSVGSGVSGVGVTASQSSQSVPFKGSFEGSQTLTPGTPPFGTVSGSATGTGTHLGEFAVTFPHTVNFANRTGVGIYTFTAANGDTLTADFTGAAQGGPLVSIVEHATVTGGTGPIRRRIGYVHGTATVQPVDRRHLGVVRRRDSSVGSGK